jgi:hypothetical protein
MALTKVGKEGITGVSNSSDATALYIDSSERVGVGATPNATFGSHLYAQGTPAANKPIISAYSTGNSNKAGIGILNDAGNRGIWTESNDFLLTTSYEGNSTVHMKIDTNGNITKPLQPCFSATAATTNIPLTTSTTVTLSAERFDQGSNLASNTFTAPITGKYLFCYIFYFAEVDADHTTLDVHIKTSNKQYQQTFSPDHFLNSDSNFGISGSMICDMDVNDTCIFTVYVSAGAQQTDIHNDSHVSGVLIC